MRTLLLSVLIVMPITASAADHSAGEVGTDTATVIEIPSDIFGFTSAADTGAMRDQGLALENDFLLGARKGRYQQFTQKLEYSFAFKENWAIAASVFGAYHNIKNVPTIPQNVTAYRFDGLSFEVRHRFIERTATQPFAVTFAIEPRWSRLDGDGFGVRSELVGVEMKLQADAPITPQLFWAVNANFASAGQQNLTTNRWTSFSGTTLSTALAYSLLEGKAFVGAEVRWVQEYSNTIFGKRSRYALFLGPTFQAKVADNISVLLTIQPQIAGKVAGLQANLDLQPLDRALARFGIALGF